MSVSPENGMFPSVHLHDWLHANARARNFIKCKVKKKYIKLIINIY